MSGDNNNDNGPQTATITMVAKYGKEKISLSNLSPSTTIAAVKERLCEKTGILPKRQKMIGLKAVAGPVSDETLLSNLKAKKAEENEAVFQFILMGTPEEQIFVDPGDREDLPDVLDDFELDFNAGSEEVSLSISSISTTETSICLDWYTEPFIHSK